MQRLKFLVQTIVSTVLLATSAAVWADDAVSFQRAVGIDNDRGVRQLLAAGVDPNLRNGQGQPMLFVALREGSFKVAEQLLAHPRIEVDATTPAGETALMIAALKGHLEWAQKLVARGAAINRDGWTPLHYAASDGATPVMAWLLDQGAAVEARAPNGNTPLMMAARYGASESVELLLARGADPRPTNQRGLAAADMARSAGRDALAERLEQLAARR